MEARVSEIAPETFRISRFAADFGIQFNSFLLRGEAPLLIHAGLRQAFPVTLEGVRQVIDPAKLRWVGFSHFESDECGALNHWLQVAPGAQAACSFVGALVMVNDFAERPPRPLSEGDVVETGNHRVRFLSTPHVPHCWDAGLFFEEAGRTLFCSDLFFHPGDPEPITESDVVGRAADAIRHNLSGPMANDMPYTPYTDATLARLASLAPATLATMHGSSFRGDGAGAIRGLAGVLRETLGKPPG